MAPGRPVLSVGIQPQIALYSAILGSVCAFSWYTEKYRRDEGDLDNRLKKMYFQTAQDTHSKMPQMAAAIRGQSMDFDGRMDKMVWGGKAHLDHGSSSSSNNNNGSEGILSAGTGDEEDDTILSTISDDEEKRARKRKKRKRKKHNTNLESSSEEQRKRNDMELEQQQTKLVVQSSIAGVAFGAISVAAVSVLLAGGGGRK
mmetsp:Transcript_15767/g.36501  ORF Transcript_15767/g.36501 Transcript_15767/m.36501 type:complete len:201 (+) Transcript_15767:122-724(+)